MNTKIFLNKYGRDTTSNFYLKDILKTEEIKASIIIRDEIKNYKNKNNLLINLQTTNKNGSHWILASKKFNIYFDSYGVVPIKEIEKYLTEDYIYNTIQVQKINTKICGQFCCFILSELENGLNFENIILDINEVC